MLKTEIQYVFKKAYMPIIINNKVIQGQEYGGQKLIYSKNIMTVRYTNFLNIFVFRKEMSRLSSDVIFLRPFKKHWDKLNHRLPPYLWGKPNKPLTNVWVKVSNQYDDITTKYKNIQFVKTYTNSNTRRLLSSATKTINHTEL